MIRSYDVDLLKERVAEHAEKAGDFDAKVWLSLLDNVMLVEGDSIGLATYEYPGMYTVHWYYTVKGREAIRLARRMCRMMFDDYGAKMLRGLTPVGIKEARWAARQVGMKSYEIVPYPGGDYELFIMSEDDLNEKEI